MLISDFFIGFHSLMWAVYLSFSLTVFLGIYMKNNNFIKIIKNSIFSAFIFFLITNFSVWIAGDFYAKNFDGLILCYIMGIPFFKYTLLSSLIFSLSLFGFVKISEKLLIKLIKYQ